MGLLDSVLGAINQASQGQAGLNSADGTGSAGGAPSGDLLGALAGLLGQGQGAGGLGGLTGLIARFQQGGLGDVVQSWVSTGQNLPVSPDQIRQVLGSDTVARLAQQLGLSHGDVAGQLSQALPHLVDQLTPDGQVPHGGLGEIAGVLGGLFNRG
ncbi:MAG: DUF937 domain-containing protein [Burkholderiales bacterium]|nr:DUF937 domain-containing protein [Burkholderiales bacterium]MDE2277356.1 DUF937 domain-containing protein [Burkholderiales bacterium]